MSKCKCKLAIIVLEVAEGCPFHKEVSGLQLERENILAALGEHPDSPVDIPQRISDIRDEGRAHFHTLTRIRQQLDCVKAEYDTKHNPETCDCYGCRRFRRAFGTTPQVRLEEQPLALACTRCGSTIHSDSFHSERCPQGYR